MHQGRCSQDVLCLMDLTKVQDVCKCVACHQNAGDVDKDTDGLLLIIYQSISLSVIYQIRLSDYQIICPLSIINDQSSIYQR